jgi:PIN domain nuclease of toxin-antitoxin system
MSAVVADTHAAVWYLLKDSRLSTVAKNAMEKAALNSEPIYVSAISLIELAYLIEKNRLQEQDLKDLLKVLRSRKSNFKLFPVNLAVTQSLRKISRADVPDMPDRIIAATALYLNLPLVTRDGKIKASGIKAIC